MASGTPGRRPRGQVVERRTARSHTFSLRFHAYGKRRFLSLGLSSEGWTRDRAEQQLRHVLADVERGLWVPPRTNPPSPAPTEVPSFHVFASEWYAATEATVRPRTAALYKSQLTHHLLPFFAKYRVDEITVEVVDRYRTAKVSDGSLSATTINGTLTRLGQILETALEYGLISTNPARGRRRRLKASRPRRPYLDRAEHIAALLSAAGALDSDARDTGRGPYRRTLLSVLIFGGLRISEALALRWRDVELAAGRLRVVDSKTDAGVRTVDLLPALRDDLIGHKQTCPRTEPDDLVFGTSTGGADTRHNVIKRVLRAAIEPANEHRGDPLPDNLRLHSLRHTCASLLFAIGWELPAVMAQIGHADGRVTLGVYAHVMRRDRSERERLQDLVEGRIGAQIGTGGDFDALRRSFDEAAETQKTPPERGFREVGATGLEPVTPSLSSWCSPS